MWTQTNLWQLYQGIIDARDLLYWKRGTPADLTMMAYLRERGRRRVYSTGVCFQYDKTRCLTFTV